MSGNQGASVSGCQGARVAGTQGVRDSGCQDSGCQGVRESGCQDIREPGCQGARELKRHQDAIRNGIAKKAAIGLGPFPELITHPLELLLPCPLLRVHLPQLLLLRRLILLQHRLGSVSFKTNLP